MFFSTCSFYNESRLEPTEGFIDGDVIESFLDLDRLEHSRGGSFSSQNIESAHPAQLS